MSTFLMFLGIVFLFMIGKFVYDTYLTNNTERDWEEFKQTHPEEAARTERSSGLDFSVKPNLSKNDRQRSLERMASNTGCEISELKDYYLNGIKKDNLSITDIKEVISVWRQKKYEESKALNIDPDDTASAFMEQWANEYLDELENQAHSDLPEKYLRQHNKKAYKDAALRAEEQLNSESSNSLINEDMVNKLKFFATDGISQFLHILNSTFYKNDDSFKEYYHLLQTSIKEIKANKEYFEYVFPHWFLTAYPDVVIWSTSTGLSQIPDNLRQKIEERKNRTSVDELNDIMNKFYEMDELTSNSFKFSELRNIVNLYKQNNKLDNEGVN